MAQDLSEVGILAEVLGLELVGADFGVSAAKVARFPVWSKAAFDVEGKRGRDGLINRAGVLEKFQLPHAPEVLEDKFGVGQDGNWIGSALALGEPRVLSWPLKIRVGTLVRLGGREKSPAKKISADRRPVSSMRPMPMSR